MFDKCSRQHEAELRLFFDFNASFEVLFTTRHVKWLKGIEFLSNYKEVGGGFGGYNEDNEYFGPRHTI